MSNIQELLPCPFCGEKPVFEQEEIYCECGICMGQGSREKDKDVIIRWNTRTNPEPENSHE